MRDVNAGPMRFYYMLGWGVPAFITGTLAPSRAYGSTSPGPPSRPVLPLPSLCPGAKFSMRIPVVGLCS